MHRRLAVVALVVVSLVAVVGVTAPRTFADQRDFTLRNRSASTILIHVYVSPAATSAWGPDRLGADVLVPGDDLTIHFAPGADAGTCFYDLRVDGDDGQRYYDRNVNLCATNTVTFGD